MKDEQMWHHFSFSILFIMTVGMLPGCVKYHKILQSEVPQGQSQPEHGEVAQTYLRSCSFYDQFQTLAIFDVLWLSDQLKTTYVKMQSERCGKDEQASEALLRRQLEENKHWISFIMLTDIRDKLYVALSEKDSAWSVFLQTVDGEKVQPISIKEIELEPEYQYFFGSRFNLFKKSYLVKFPAKPLDGTAYLDRGNSFKMTIASTKRVSSVEWSAREVKTAQKKVLADEDFYWS